MLLTEYLLHLKIYIRKSFFKEHLDQMYLKVLKEHIYLFLMLYNKKINSFYKEYYRGDLPIILVLEM